MAEHVQTLTRHERSGSGDNPLGIKGVDHIEFFVDDAAAWADWHENKMGMYRRAAGDPSTGLKGRKAIICGQGRVNMLFAEPAGPKAAAMETSGFKRAARLPAWMRADGGARRDVSLWVR